MPVAMVRVQVARRAGAIGVFVGGGLILTGIAAALLVNVISGVCLVMMGWFLLSSARSGAESAVTEALVAGAMVADVMTSEPQRVPEWITVDALIHDHILTGRHRAYPISDFGGRLIGLVTLAAVSGVLPGLRSVTTVGQIATPIEGLVVVTPQTPLGELLTQLSHVAGRRALVHEQGRLVGIVTMADVARRRKRIEMLHIQPPRAA